MNHRSLVDLPLEKAYAERSLGYHEGGRPMAGLIPRLQSHLALTALAVLTALGPPVGHPAQEVLESRLLLTTGAGPHLLRRRRAAATRPMARPRAPGPPSVKPLARLWPETRCISPQEHTIRQDRLTSTIVVRLDLRSGSSRTSNGVLSSAGPARKREPRGPEFNWKLYHRTRFRRICDFKQYGR